MKSKSVGSRKRELEVEDELIGFVKIVQPKKRKLSQVEVKQETESENKVSRPLRSTRSLRSSSSFTDNGSNLLEECQTKEKENNLSKRVKTSHDNQRLSSRSPDQILKNAKLNSNSRKLNALHSESDNEDDNLFLSTPKSKRFSRQLNYQHSSHKIKVNETSPEHIGLRTPTSKSIPPSPKTPLEKARTSLHVSSVPESLPCREREFKNVFSFLENKLLDGIGGCMYISGVPGTGKTATVTQVIKKLQGMADEGRVPHFKFIEINGMRLADPRQAYILLWKGLSERKEKISAEQAQRKLDSWFGKADPREMKMPTLLLVDELDLICTKKQDVVYNLLDWPTKSPSRLIVVTIANTMDMPERLFKGRVTSRLGLTRLTFLPYTYKQLEEIVLARLTGLNAFTLDAVRLVTRKVAAVSGDARRSLDICRRATELPAEDETVKICHIEQAIREMTNSNSVKIIRSCSALEKLFLRSVSEVSTRTGVEEVDMRDVIEHFLAVCTLEGYSRIPVSHILHISNRLKCFRLLFINQPQNGILQRLTLNVTQDDIHYGLKCDA